MSIYIYTELYAEILQGGGANLGYLKKRGAHLQAASGGALEDNVKNYFGNIKGGEIYTRGRTP